MTDNELSIKLREDARRLGLCDEWYGKWKDNTDTDELVAKFKRGLDFCLKHRWPSQAFITQHFSQEFLRDNGILINDTRSYPVRDENRRLIYHREYVLIGKSDITVRYSFRPHMCNIWACDDSHVRVFAKYGAFMMIHLLDNASADINTDLVSKVTVIRHSPNIKIKKEGIVNVRDEFHYLE